MVSLTEWIDRLRAVDASDKAEVAKKPALKILTWLADVEAGVSSEEEEAGKKEGVQVRYGEWEEQE